MLHTREMLSVHPMPWWFRTFWYIAYRIAFKFGIIAMLSGIIGVPLGSYLVQRWRPRYTVKCDALVCAGGLLISAPFVYASLVAAAQSIHLCFACMFIAEVSLNLCWSIVADMLLVRSRQSCDDDTQEKDGKNGKERRIIIHPGIVLAKEIG